MRAFLLKVNGDTRCPDGVNIPASVDDWASGEFSSKRTKNQFSIFAGGAAGQLPEPGDKVYIWVNENGEKSSGRGLTALAMVMTVSTKDEQYDFTVGDLSLLQNTISMDRAVATLPDSLIIKEIARLRHERTWALTELDIRDFAALIEGAGGLKESFAPHPLEAALIAEATSLETALQERKTAATKARPGQSSFRRAAFERHNGRCVFTKTKVAEVLEAAHVIPHTGAPAFERADNALLLRRDIHALFDLFLLSIDTETGKILVSNDLKDSMYAKLADRAVNHQLSRHALEFHATNFHELRTS